MRCVNVHFYGCRRTMPEKDASPYVFALLTSERKERTEADASWQTLLRTRIHMTDARYTCTIHNTQTHSESNRSEQTPNAFSLVFYDSCFVCTYILKYKSYRSLDIYYISENVYRVSQSNHIFELLSLIIVKLERKIVRQKGAHRKERYKHHWIGQDDRLHTLNFINFDDRDYIPWILLILGKHKKTVFQQVTSCQ